MRKKVKKPVSYNILVGTKLREGKEMSDNQQSVKKAKCIMIQGTASSVGKSIIAAGLCRIFNQDGHSVAPFKSQNMALNSYVTLDGKEMGRAQVVQAEAAGLEPDVLMNPVLLKPVSDRKAQIIINGEVYGNMSAAEYHEFKPQLSEMIKQVYEKLASMHDIIVIEGAGSPAEINLKDKDIVNMGMAEIADAPVILVGDIDKGGVFAALAGTMLLLDEKERKRIKGVIINKFRGDVDILKPGLKMLEDIIKVPVLGVVPYFKLSIDDEDSAAFEGKDACNSLTDKSEIEIAVAKLPRMSNFTDFRVLEMIPSVKLKYVQKQNDLYNADLIIIPGSKNTIEDLIYLRNSGIEERIKQLNKKGVPVMGICGGYQMLGMEIEDPYGSESSIAKIKGMELLDVKTTMRQNKTRTQVEAVLTADEGLLEGLKGRKVRGYEIHMGETEIFNESIPWLKITNILGQAALKTDGAINRQGNVFGTYLHGIFDSIDFTVGLINNIRKSKGLEILDLKNLESLCSKEIQYNKLADILRESIDINAIYEIIGI